MNGITRRQYLYSKYIFSDEKIKMDAYFNDVSYREFLKMMRENQSKRRDYHLKFLPLQYIGMLTVYYDSDKETFIEPGFKKPARNLSYEEIDEAVAVVGEHSKAGAFSSTNRLLYAMLKTQDQAGIDGFVIPNTLDLLCCLQDLNFSYTRTYNIATRKDGARDALKKVLPYQIASKELKNPSFQDRVKARLDGYDIIQMLDFFYDSLDLEYPFLPLDSCEQYVPDRNGRVIISRLTKNNGRRLLEIMNSIRSYSNQICEDASFFDYLEKRPITEAKKPIHHVSMIYACSLMGEENVENLFSMTESELEQHTKDVRSQYVQHHFKFKRK